MYKGGRDRQHRKDIQKNEKQGKDRKELYRVVLDRERGKTGCPLSSLLFILFVADIEEYLRKR